MSVVVFLSVQLCVLISLSVGFPLVSHSNKPYGGVSDQGSSLSYQGVPVQIQNWEQTVFNPPSGHESRVHPAPTSSLSSAQQFESNSLPLYAHVAKASSSRPKSQLTPSSDSFNSIAHANTNINADTPFLYKTANYLTKSSKSANQFPRQPNLSDVQTDESGALQFHSRRPKIKANHSSGFSDYAIPANQPRSLQLAVEQEPEGQGQTGASQVVISVGTSLVVLFSLGVVIGIFGCCCKKQQASDENKNNSGKQTTENEDGGFGDQKNKKPSVVVNPSDIPPGEADLDDPVSVKDKIKALDSKLIIQPSPDHVAKRKSQADVLADSKAQNANNVNQPQILISDEDVLMRDKTKSKSIGDNISKSDTQDDISDKIFDNVSTHSSISQPHNPDVVIADTDEEDEFAEIQRGTVILKSFQRAKPPRNRSPATRTSKGKIRKSRPHQDRSTDTEKAKSQEASKDREEVSVTSSLSLSPSQGTSSKTNSLDKLETPANKSSLDKAEPAPTAPGAKVDSPMTKSSDFSDFDSIMSQSVTSIGSDVGNSRKHESPLSARHKRSKDSPKGERAERTDSPARVSKSREREITAKESRTESPNRYKKNTDSPKSKHRHRRRERERDLEHHNGKSEGTMDSTGTEAGNTNSAPHRLSGIPAGANNNIFYLIDPTVKNKCKSVGDIMNDKRRSGDYGNRKSGDFGNRRSGDFSREGGKASKHKMNDSPDSPDGKTDECPEKRGRTNSNRSSPSKEVENTQL